MGEPRLGADGSFSVRVGAGAEAVVVRARVNPIVSLGKQLLHMIE